MTLFPFLTSVTSHLDSGNYLDNEREIHVSIGFARICLEVIVECDKRREECIKVRIVQCNERQEECIKA